MKNFFKSKKAVASVEFAMLVLPLLVFITVLIESLLLIYQSVVINYVGEQAAKQTSTINYKLNYAQKFRDNVLKIGENLLFFANDESLQTELTYCKSLDEFIKQSCSGDDNDNKLIVYELRYLLNPLFAYNWLDIPKDIRFKTIFYSERNAEVLDK